MAATPSNERQEGAQGREFEIKPEGQQGKMDCLPSVSVIIPVFRAESTLKDIYDQLVITLSACTDQFEIVFVEDCGGDSSWKVIQDLARKDSRVIGLKLFRNFGQHNALLCGLRRARYPLSVTLDDDLQNPPQEIPKMLKALTEDVDVVYGKPESQTHGLFRNSAANLTKLVLQSVMGASTARNVSPFRVFRTELREAFADFCSPTVSIDVLLTWGTDRFAAVTVRQDHRNEGSSGYTIGKLVTYGFEIMTGYTAVPLRIASFTGFVFVLFGIGVLAWVLGRYWFFDGDAVQGFPFLASTIAIFSGVQLFSLGIIGEYIARIHFRTMNRPPYLVSAETRSAVTMKD